VHQVGSIDNIPRCVIAKFIVMSCVLLLQTKFSSYDDGEQLKYCIFVE